MVGFYKHEISAWRNGTGALSDRAYRVYHVIIEEIMLNEGPIPLHERSLAGKANRSTRDFRAAIQELLTLKKIEIENGYIDNLRTKIELDDILLNRKNASLGGKNSAKSRRKLLEYSSNTPRILLEDSSNGIRTLDEKSGNNLEQVKNDNDFKGDDEAPLNVPMKSKREEKRREEYIKHMSEPSSDLNAKNSDDLKKQKPPRNSYSVDFEIFWSGYPTDQNMSKKQADKVWMRLSEDDRKKAIDSLPAFRAYCEAHPDYRPKHAEGYLSQAKYEGHLAASQKISAMAYVKKETPQWDAWEKFYRATKRTSPPVDAKGGWSFPSEWPPEIEIQNERNAA